MLLFNLLIGIHELGHFLAARWRGLKVERFAIWFGKPIWKKKIGDIEYARGIMMNNFTPRAQQVLAEQRENHQNAAGDEAGAHRHAEGLARGGGSREARIDRCAAGRVDNHEQRREGGKE